MSVLLQQSTNGKVVVVRVCVCWGRGGFPWPISLSEHQLRPCRFKPAASSQRHRNETETLLCVAHVSFLNTRADQLRQEKVEQRGGERGRRRGERRHRLSSSRCSSTWFVRNQKASVIYDWLTSTLIRNTIRIGT